MKNTKKISINLYTMLFLVLLFPYVKSEYLSVSYPIVDTLYDTGVVITFVLIIVIMLIKKHFSKLLFWIIVYELVLILSSFINNVEYMSAIKLAIKTLGFCFIVDYGLSARPKRLLVALLLIFEIHLLINCYTIIRYPEGMYVSSIANYTENFFLGYDNLHILYILPTIFISTLFEYAYKNKMFINTYFVLIVSFISMFLTWSATGIVGLVSIFLFIILYEKIMVFKKISLDFGLIAYLLLFLSIVVFRIQEAFSFLILKVLKKDLTFTNRTYIWDYTFNFIAKKPFIGYGLENPILKMQKTTMYHTLHAHNQILEIIYTTGFIGLGIFIVIISMIKNQLKKCKDNFLEKISIWIVMTYLIMMLVEAYELNLIFFMLVIIYNINNISKEFKYENEK